MALTNLKAVAHTWPSAAAAIGTFPGLLSDGLDTTRLGGNGSYMRTATPLTFTEIEDLSGEGIVISKITINVRGFATGATSFSVLYWTGSSFVSAGTMTYASGSTYYTQALNVFTCNGNPWTKSLVNGLQIKLDAGASSQTFRIAEFSVDVTWGYAPTGDMELLRSGKILWL